MKTKTPKFTQLLALFRTGKSAISEDIRLVDFVRLVDGDLSHIGNALLLTQGIHFTAFNTINYYNTYKFLNGADFYQVN